MSPRDSQPEALILSPPDDAVSRSGSFDGKSLEPREQIMKMRVLLTLSVLAVGLSVSALAQQKDTADSQLAQQLEATGRTSDEGFNKGDAAAIAALFTQDAVLLLEDGPVYGKPGY